MLVRFLRVIVETTYKRPDRVAFVEMEASLKAGQVVEPSREMHSCARAVWENKAKAPNKVYFVMVMFEKGLVKRCRELPVSQNSWSFPISC